MSYRRGRKYDNGREILPLRRVTVESSDGYTVYTVTIWEDGGISCNCPGWAFRKRCRHQQQALSQAALASTSPVLPSPRAASISKKPAPIMAAPRSRRGYQLEE
ncbi:MAG: SWIM zinc finger family protein [Nitrospirota bacterium]